MTSVFSVSGTVRARVESPLAFQVGGRIVERRVDAGQNVRAGEMLLRLDGRDLEQAMQAASAEVAAAEAALATAEAELLRVRQLHRQSFISAQAVDRAEQQRREALSRRDAAAARREQARNARGYAALTSPAAGVLVDVLGEIGQVVAAGQPVAVLAQGETREIEVFLPERLSPPVDGEVLLPDGRTLPLRLREAAGSVEPQGRTRRARYTVHANAESLLLGSVLRTRFKLAEAGQIGFMVPIGALDERGAGARLWRVRDGRLQAVPVQLLAVDGERAQVAGALTPGEEVVALGTHLLREGMAVRVLPR